MTNDQASMTKSETRMTNQARMTNDEQVQSSFGFRPGYPQAGGVILVWSFVIDPWSLVISLSASALLSARDHFQRGP